MVAPALVAVNVPAGTDHVVFRFHGYRDYPVLLALSVVILVIIAVAPVCVRHAKHVRTPSAASDATGSPPSHGHNVASHMPA